MTAKFQFSTMLFAVMAISLTSCSANDEELQTINAKPAPIEVSEQMQREGDSIIVPNENEPIIVKPRK